MANAKKLCLSRSQGAVSVVALLFLAMFATMSLEFFESTETNLAEADNTCSALQARLAAESGLAFCAREIENNGVSGCLRGQPLLDAMAAQIKTDLNGTGNLGAQTVGYNSTTITIPAIALPGGGSFNATITLAATDTLTLNVTGYWNQGCVTNATAVQKGITMNLQATGNPAFGFGISSMGPIAVGNNLIVKGVLASEGSMYSAATGAAITVGNNGTISGALSVSASKATISLGNNVTAGSVNYNVPPITMPTVDRSAYAALATNIVNSTTNVSSGVFTNIRIKANTNPVFGNNVTILGLMYVEAPNIVQFGNNVSFTGVIVADDPPVGSPDSANSITFNNNTTLNGVGQLPDTAAFQQLINMPGTSILAPGFTVKFLNNFGSIDGTIAVKSLIAGNNLNSTLNGSILIYGSGGLDLTNNATLNISMNLSQYNRVPPGFQGYGQPQIGALPDTYAEK